MLRIAFALLMMMLAGPGSAAGPQQALAAFHAALAAGDKAKATELLAADVLIYESGFVERSRDEYASHHLSADMAFSQAVTRKVLQHGVRSAGSQAVIWEETETTGTYKGKPVHLFGTETAVLEKKGDGWVIVHVHWSSRKAK